jgi:uncharacterized membrane protein
VILIFILLYQNKNPLRTNYSLIAGQNVKRIEALSGGVFAIALTLLVLEIKVPEVQVAQYTFTGSTIIYTLALCV